MKNWQKYISRVLRGHKSMLRQNTWQHIWQWQTTFAYAEALGMLKMSSKSCASTYSCIIWWWLFCSLLHNGTLQSSRSVPGLYSGVLETFLALNFGPAKVSIELNWKYLKRLFIFWLIRIENAFWKMLIAFIVNLFIL